MKAKQITIISIVLVSMVFLPVVNAQDYELQVRKGDEKEYKVTKENLEFWPYAKQGEIFSVYISSIRGSNELGGFPYIMYFDFLLNGTEVGSIFDILESYPARSSSTIEGLFFGPFIVPTPIASYLSLMAEDLESYTPKEEFSASGNQFTRTLVNGNRCEYIFDGSTGWLLHAKIINDGEILFEITALDYQVGIGGGSIPGYNLIPLIASLSLMTLLGAFFLKRRVL